MTDVVILIRKAKTCTLYVCLLQSAVVVIVDVLFTDYSTFTQTAFFLTVTFSEL